MTGADARTETRGAVDPPVAPVPGPTLSGGSVDPHAAAVVTVAWLIVANKPIYPVYVWWFAGSGTAAAMITLLAAPAFLAIALFGARHPLAARLALPVVGALDTLVATGLFGAASGTELFLLPCLLLAVTGFRPAEARWSRALVVLLFAAFALAHGRMGPAWGPWSPAEAARLLEVNIWAVASLSAFIAWRFAGLGR